MAKFLLTNRAATDLSDIADFTIQTFGIEQARAILNKCHFEQSEKSITLIVKDSSLRSE